VIPLSTPKAKREASASFGQAIAMDLDELKGNRTELITFLGKFRSAMQPLRGAIGLGKALDQWCAEAFFMTEIRHTSRGVQQMHLLKIMVWTINSAPTLKFRKGTGGLKNLYTDASMGDPILIPDTMRGQAGD
jgi:hypothetical protein